MLDRVPSFLPALDSAETATISYTNVAAQLDAVGITPPTSFDDPGFKHWLRANDGVDFPSLTQYYRSFPEDYGFSMLEVDETLEIAAPPFGLTLLRGGFDYVAVFTSLLRLGYAPITPESSILAVLPDFETDYTSPTLPTYASPLMNVAAFLDDGTLVFAPARSIVESVLALQTDQMESLAERPDIAKLLPHVPTDLASVAIIGGQTLASDSAASTDAGSMPPVLLALVGNTVGGPLLPDPRSRTPTPIRDGAPTSREICVLLMRTAAAAVEAVPVVESRLATGVTVPRGTSLSEYFSRWEVRTVPEEPVLLIDLAPASERSRGVLFTLLAERNLVFVAW